MEDLNALRQTLRERLRECYENRKAFWEQLDPLDLIAYAEEIYASQVILENLPDALSEEEIRFLMQYEDPLEIARDYWISAYGFNSGGNATKTSIPSITITPNSSIKVKAFLFNNWLLFLLLANFIFLKNIK